MFSPDAGFNGTSLWRFRTLLVEHLCALVEVETADVFLPVRRRLWCLILGRSPAVETEKRRILYSVAPLHLMACGSAFDVCAALLCAWRRSVQQFQRNVRCMCIFLHDVGRRRSGVFYSD